MPMAALAQVVLSSAEGGSAWMRIRSPNGAAAASRSADTVSGSRSIADITSR
jgi:hypothetical protein